VPVRPLLLGGQKEWAMFADLKRYPQVIAPLYYSDDAMLLDHLESKVIAPAEKRAEQLAGKSQRFLSARGPKIRGRKRFASTKL